MRRELKGGLDECREQFDPKAEEAKARVMAIVATARAGVALLGQVLWMIRGEPSWVALQGIGSGLAISETVGKKEFK